MFYNSYNLPACVAKFWSDGGKRYLCQYTKIPALMQDNFILDHVKHESKFTNTEFATKDIKKKTFEYFCAF